MLYKYVATQPDGQVVEDNIEAKEVAGVLAFLSSKGLKPVSVKSAARGLGAKKAIFGGGITISDKIFISKHLALMLRIGTSLLQAINMLIDDFGKASVRDFLVEVRSNLEKGQPFHLAFAKYPKVFSKVYVNLVKAGEATGNLEKVFENLTQSLAKEKELKDQIRGALIYPIILLASSVLVLLFLVTFALPRVAKVFLEGGFDPPAFSKVVFSVGLFFGQFGIYIIVLLIVAVIALIYLYKSSIYFKRLVGSIVKDFPVVRDLVKKIALQRFGVTLSSLIEAGMPITEALEITAGAVSHDELRDSLLRVARKELVEGVTLGEAFRKDPVFPRTVANLVTISEKGGRMGEVLLLMSDFYTSEIDGSLKSTVAFLEPILLLFLGLVIGVIALSVIIPIYQLTVQF